MRGLQAFGVRWRWWRNRLRERLRGIDVLRAVPVNELEFDPSHGSLYVSSGNDTLRQVLRTLNISAEDSIVDLGCGKGGAILVLAEFPFRRIVGVELSNRLYTTARRNVERARLGQVELVLGDAAEFDDYDSLNYVYTYDSFPAPVMRQVVDRIQASISRVDRPFQIIYKHPVCHEEILRDGLFRLERVSGDGPIANQFNIYASP